MNEIWIMWFLCIYGGVFELYLLYVVMEMYEIFYYVLFRNYFGVIYMMILSTDNVY